MDTVLVPCNLGYTVFVIGQCLKARSTLWVPQTNVAVPTRGCNQRLAWVPFAMFHVPKMSFAKTGFLFFKIQPSNFDSSRHSSKSQTPRVLSAHANTSFSSEGQNDNARIGIDRAFVCVIFFFFKQNKKQYLDRLDVVHVGLPVLDDSCVVRR